MTYIPKVPYNKANPTDLAQLSCLKQALVLDRYGVFFEQRVGKTRVAIDFIGYHISRGENLAMIFCPLCAQEGWRQQLKQYLGNTGKKVHVATVDATHKTIPTVRPLIVICTYDKAIRMQLTLAKDMPTIVVFDEVHLLKNYSSKRSRIIGKFFGKSAKYVLGLTGTPYSNKLYSDVYGIFRAINANLFGTSWTKFKDRYCHTYGYIVTGYKNTDEIDKTVAENSIRVLRKDVLTEPEIENIEVITTQTKRERRHYDMMLEQKILELEKASDVTADLLITHRLKLHQLASGWVKNDEGELVVLGTSKLTYLQDLLNTFPEGEPVIICCKYTHDINTIQKTLGIPAIQGNTPPDKRLEIIKEFTAGAIGQMVVQEITISMGLDLAVAKKMVFYNWGEDTIVHRQVKDRLLGRSQKSDIVQYYYLIADKTIDKVMYKLLNKKISKADQAANWRTWLGVDDIE